MAAIPHVAPLVNRHPHISTGPSVYLLYRAIHRAQAPRQSQRRSRAASGTQHRHQWRPPIHCVAAAPPAVATANTLAEWGSERFQQLAAEMTPRPSLCTLSLPQVPIHKRQARRRASAAQTTPSMQVPRPPPSATCEKLLRGWGHACRRGRRGHRRPGACSVAKTVRQEQPTTLGVVRGSTVEIRRRGGRGTRLTTAQKISMNRAGGSLPDGEQV